MQTALKTPGRYLDPLIDFAFKRIFGTAPNKDLLIDFLNAIFDGRKQITDLVYSKNEHPGELKTEGGAIFDLICTGDKGEHFIIEIQRGRQENFKQRALFYTSRLISGQAPHGKRKDWRYQLDEVYLIALLENRLIGENDDQRYIHDICLCNRRTGEVFYEQLNYIYIELRNFVKTADLLQTALDKWLFVLKHMSSMRQLPVYLQEPAFEKLFAVAEYSNLKKEEKMSYDRSLMYKWDNQNVLDYALKEGREQGKAEALKNVVREMKKEQVPLEKIVRFTQLSVQEIENM